MIKIVKEIDQSIVDHVINAIEADYKAREDWCNNIIKYDDYKKLSVDKVFDRIGGGCNGTVFEYKGYIVKMYERESEYCWDGKMLDVLNGSCFFPTVYAYSDNFMIAEKINGINASKYERGRGALLSSMFKNHLEEAFKYADEKGVELNDLTMDNIMINEKGLPVIVDAGTFNLKGERIRLSYGDKNFCREWVNSFLANHFVIKDWAKFDVTRELTFI